jgi:pSer/pThr/pTyr-binding forkhead associated (FHA) protein
VVKTAARDLRAPQESFVMAPAQAHAPHEEGAESPARLVVLASSSLPVGEAFEAGPVPLTLGRADDNVVALAGDDYASAHHARIEAGRDGVWLVDLDSTNGTWVNDGLLDGRGRLRAGDVVRIGRTELRLER